VDLTAFNFHVYIISWQCGAKLKRGQGINFNKFKISRMVNESLFKLGMGEKGIVTTWCKLVATNS
jgi:hypothetical protein